MKKQLFRAKQCLAYLLSGVLLLSTFGGLSTVSAEDSVVEGDYVLGVSDFTVDSRLSLTAVSGTSSGLSLTNATAYGEGQTPNMIAQLRVDVDQAPVIYVNTASTGDPVRYKVVFWDTSETNPVKHSVQVDDGQWAEGTWTGLYQVNMKEKYGWSGVKTIGIEVDYCSFNTDISSPSQYTFVFNGIGFKSGSKSITATTNLQSSDFTVDSRLSLTQTGDAMTLTNAAAYGQYQSPTATAQFSVNVDEIPYICVDTASVDPGIQYKVVFWDASEATPVKHSVFVADGQWAEGSWTGPYQVDMASTYGWSGTKTIEVEITYCSYNANLTVPSQYSVVFNQIGFKMKDSSSVITMPTALKAFQFIPDVNTKLIPMATGDGFVMTHTNTWSTSYSNFLIATTTVTVDVDKVPVLYLAVGGTDVQYDASYVDTDDAAGTKHYINNSKDAADWRVDPGYIVINLKSRHNWSGVKHLKIELDMIFYQTAAVSSAETYKNYIEGIGFAQTDFIQMHRYFSDGMVFQQNQPMTLFGMVAANAPVTLSLYEHGNDTAIETKNVTASADGQFSGSFAARAGGYTEYSIKVESGGSTYTINDVVIGEVWLTSGQSNMQWKLNWTPEGHSLTTSDFNDPYLRGVLISDSGSTDAVWASANGQTTFKSMSAVSYYAAKEMRTKLNVPVAVIDTSLGSTSIYQWLPQDAFTGDTSTRTYIQNQIGDKWGGLYNNRIHPLAGIHVRGMLWYQGEANVSESAGHYRKAMESLRAAYGKLFGFTDSTMPLILAHLAPYRYDGLSFDQLPAFADEISAICAAAPSVTAQIPIYDEPLDYDTGTGLGWVSPIHPASKIGVGTRMGDAALNMIYSSGKEYTAPIYKSAVVKDGAVFVTFDHVGDGLAVKSGGTELKGFGICGANRIYVDARAEIVSKDTVKIYSSNISSPIAVTYAFAEMNNESNLVSTQSGGDYLPAVPFGYNPDTYYDHYYRPHDWSYCDDTKLWQSDSNSGSYMDAWQASNGVVLSYPTDVKESGNSSLQADYTSTANGQISISPVLSQNGTLFASRDANYSFFGGMQVMIMNKGNHTVTFSGLKLTTSDGTAYTPVVTGTDGTTTPIPNDGQWHAVKLDFSKMFKGNGTVADSTSKVLTTIKGISLAFSDGTSASGSILLDDISFSPLASSTLIANGPATIETNTKLDPKSFVVSANTMDLAINGYTFTTQVDTACPNLWPDINAVVRLDVSKVPIMTVDITSAQANYKLIITDMDSGESFNFFDNNYSFECSPKDPTGVTKVNIAKRMNWTGVHNLQIKLYMILNSDDHSVINSFKSIGFETIASGNGGNKETSGDNESTSAAVDTSLGGTNGGTSPDTGDHTPFLIPAALLLLLMGSGFVFRRLAAGHAN